ncbi:MAG: hypothetical protein QXG12_06465 [Thermoproteota archaeon]
MKLYFSERVTGAPNTLVLGTGLVSTEVEPKIIKGLYIIVSARNGNMVEAWIERERILQILDTIFNLASDAFRLYIPVDVDLPIGRRFVVGVRSGASATNIDVTYEYEIK